MSRVTLSCTDELIGISLEQCFLSLSLSVSSLDSVVFSVSVSGEKEMRVESTRWTIDRDHPLLFFVFFF